MEEKTLLYHIDNNFTMYLPTTPEIDGVPSLRYVVLQMLEYRHMTLTAAVKRLNEKFPEYKTSVQNLNNKLNRNSLKPWELAQLAIACDCKLSIGGQSYQDDTDGGLVDLQGNQLVSDHQTVSDSIPRKREVKPIRQTTKTFDELIDEGYCESKTINFVFMIIAGAKCKEAAQYVEERLTEDMTEMQERQLFAKAARLFDIKWKPIEKNMARLLGLLPEE